ncbi:hypothetical protein [Paludisphaera soli]|uniref:hypothetical protein n=1 Tax=Paludisphaera soli TaxID=2712865 RepID=UPI0013EBD3D5|nr:hypothetical protein [Paludisphaera soli]
MSRLGWMIVACWPLAAVGQAPAPDTLAAIKAEEDAARRSFVERAREVKAAEDARAADEAYHAKVQSLMDRALTLARSHPGEPENLAAPAWVASQAAIARGDAIAKRGDAAYRLLADAPVLDDTAILPAMFAAPGVGPRCPEAEPFLRSVISRSRNPDLVTLARFGLGTSLAEMARLHDRLAAPISGPALAKELTEASRDRCRAVDAPKLRGEAEALLEEVVREQGDGPNTLGGQAAGDLYRIRHLRIGQPAPDLVGEDLDGAPIRLRDFRGQVVILAF